MRIARGRALRISIPGVLLDATVGKGGFLRPGRYPTGNCFTMRISDPQIAATNDRGTYAANRPAKMDFSATTFRLQTENLS